MTRSMRRGLAASALLKHDDILAGIEGARLSHTYGDILASFRAMMKPSCIRRQLSAMARPDVGYRGTLILLRALDDDISLSPYALEIKPVTQQARPVIFQRCAPSFLRLWQHQSQ